MRLLFYGESPLNPTGFGLVNKHVLAACARVAEVTAVATTHYHEDYDHEKYPYTIVGCEIVDVPLRDATHQRNLPRIHAAIDAMDWDVFFYAGDLGWNNDILAKVGRIQQEHPEKHSIFYSPIDGDVSLEIAFNVWKLCSVPATYTHHGKSVVAKYAPDVADHMSVMWLGTEPEVFYPLPEEERKAARLKLFGEAYADQFLCINVNRNQTRKDLARCMAAFHLFHKKHSDSSLYLHSVMTDAGGHLPTQALLTGCDIFKRPAEVLFSSLDLANAWSRETLNELYNAADCLVSTAYGEGWGLTTTEAMCAGIPVVVPAGTANLDILGEYNIYLPFERERGWGVTTGGDLDHTAFIYSNGGGPVSFVHSDSFVQTLEYVYDHPHRAKEKAKVARTWCIENSWERRESEWEQLLTLMLTSASPSLATIS